MCRADGVSATLTLGHITMTLSAANWTVTFDLRVRALWIPDTLRERVVTHLPLITLPGKRKPHANPAVRYY